MNDNATHPPDFELMRELCATLECFDAITIQFRSHTAVEICIPDLGCFDVNARPGVANISIDTRDFPFAEQTIESMTEALAQAIAHRVDLDLFDAHVLTRWQDLLARPMPVALRNPLARIAAQQGRARIEAAQARKDRAFVAFTQAMDDSAAAHRLTALGEEQHAAALRETP